MYTNAELVKRCEEKKIKLGYKKMNFWLSPKELKKLNKISKVKTAAIRACIEAYKC